MEKTDIDISSFFSIDEEIMASAFGVDSEVLKEALSDLDTSDFDLGLDDIIKLDMSDLLSGIEDAKLIEAAESNITKLVNDFTSWLAIRMEEPTFCDDYPSLCAIIDQNTSTIQETDTPEEPSVPIETVDAKELGALGCGMAAAIAAGVYKDYKEAAEHMVHVSGRVEPNPEMTAIYQEKYKKYRAVSKALDTVWAQFEV